MSAVIRTVRGLDHRPGEAGRETLQVRGITIDRGVPVPAVNRRSALTEALLVMQVGDSVEWTTPAMNHRSLIRRKHPERRFTAQKSGSKFRIWRTK